MWNETEKKFTPSSLSLKTLRRATESTNKVDSKSLDEQRAIERELQEMGYML